MATELSIIIVNYKTPALVNDCLKTIYDQTSGLQPEIIIVDNASGDNSRSQILNAWPLVRWIQMPANVGFARANNEGIRQSQADTVLLLNSDTLNIDSAIEKCFYAFASSPYIACGVQLLNADHTPQISGNYFMKGGLNYLLPLPYVGNFVKYLGNLVKVKKPNIPEARGLVEVDWINGAFLMVKKHAIAVAGLMDEDFFLYAEEAEWCARLRKAGKLCIYGAYHVLHLQGASANETFGSTGQGYYNLYDRKGLQIMLSNFVRIRKQFGLGWFFLQLLVFTATIPVFFIAASVENLVKLKNPLADFERAGAFTLNMARLWKFVPVIVSGRPYFYKVL